MTFIITGKNQYGETISETFSDEVLHDSLVTGIAAMTREKYASIGIDIDEELRKMTAKKPLWRRCKIACIVLFNRCRYAIFGNRWNESLW